MKKTFLAKRNALLSSASVSWGAAALTFSVLALLLRLLAPNLFLHTFAPAFSVADAIAAQSHRFFSSFSDAAALAAQNERLVSENAALIAENAALEQKAASVGALADSQRSSGILAGVISRPPESPYDTLVLAAGERAGVMLGQEAFGEGGVPLGVVSSVTADFSRVTLFSAPNVVTHGWVGNAHIPLSLFGAGAGAMSASLARAAGVAVGDTVFAPGPGMLPVGRVVRIDSDPSTTTVTLRIMPALNPFSLSWVQLRDVGAALRGSFTIATSTL